MTLAFSCAVMDAPCFRNSEVSAYRIVVYILTLSPGPCEHMDSSSSQTSARSWYGIQGCYFLIQGGNFPEKSVLEPSRQFP